MTTDALKQIRFLAASLKAPRISEAAARLADHARDTGWTHEDYLAAVLEREVAARNRGRPRNSLFVLPEIAVGTHSW